MTETLRLIPVVLLWGVVIARLPTRRQGGPARTLWLTFATCAVAGTLDLPGLAAAIDTAFARPNLSHLLKHGVLLVAAGAAREVVRNLALPPAAAAHDGRRRAAALVAALLGLAVLFALAPVHETRTIWFTARYATEPVMLAYWTVFVAFLSSALLSILLVTRWYLVHAPAGPLRSAMRGIQLGAAAGLGYAAHKVLYLLARLSGLPDGLLISSMETVSAALLAVSTALLVIGVSWPSILHLPGVRHLANRRAHHRLYPLWQALYEATPTIALTPPNRLDQDDSAPLRDIEVLLYRRVIEIRDGLLALRPYLSPGLRPSVRAEVAKSQAGPRGEVLAEAVCLELARRAKLRGDLPVPQVDETVAGGTDLAGEVRLLQRIAAAQPVVTSIADRIEAVMSRQDSRAR